MRVPTKASLGSVMGLIWGTADAFVGNAVFAWLYNRIVQYAGDQAK